jgi:hypothetical protein
MLGVFRNAIVLPLDWLLLLSLCWSIDVAEALPSTDSGRIRMKTIRMTGEHSDFIVADMQV